MSAALVVPSALPYLIQKRATPEFERSFSETVRLSADLLDYLCLNSENILAQLIPRVERARDLHEVAAFGQDVVYEIK